MQPTGTRHTPRNTHHPKRILVVKLADLGDLINVTPALQALRAAHPQARIDLLVSPSSASLLKNSGYIDRIVTYDKLALSSLRGLFNPKALVGTFQFLLRLMAARYDTFLLFHHCTTRAGMIKFAILALVSRAQVRAGLDSGCKPFLTHRTLDEGFGAKHEADYWLSVAALVGANSRGGWKTHLAVNSQQRKQALALLTGLISKGGNKLMPLLAIHPGAGAYSKARIWPTERFAAMAQALTISHNAAIIVLGGPDETEMAAALSEMIGADCTIINLAGRTNIHETAAVIEQCDLFLGNDSGPMHIAAAMQTPVVAVFGPSNRHAWGPYTPPGVESIHKVISRDLPCQPCFYRAYSLGLKEGCGPRPCLAGLHHSVVLKACIEALSRGKYERQ